MRRNELVPSSPGEFLIYQTVDGKTRVQVRFEGELRRDSVVAEFATTAANGMTDRQIHTHAGKASRETAKLKAEAELEKFRKTQDALPRPVDEHFKEAIDELKKIEGEAKKRKGRKKKDGEK